MGGKGSPLSPPIQYTRPLKRCGERKELKGGRQRSKTNKTNSKKNKSAGFLEGHRNNVETPLLDLSPYSAFEHIG